MSSNDTKLMVKLATFVGAYLRDQMPDQYTPTGDEKYDSFHHTKIVEMVLNAINFGSDCFMTEFVIWIYHGEIDLKRKPDDTLHLPSIVTSMQAQMGDRIMIDPDVNKRWPNMVVGQVGIFPYAGERVIPILTAVSGPDEAQALIDLLSLRMGSDRQEESLQSQEGQMPETAQTDQAPESDHTS